LNEFYRGENDSIHGKNDVSDGLNGVCHGKGGVSGGKAIKMMFSYAGNIRARSEILKKGQNKDIAVTIR
jgi:hypothetical protein